MSVALMALGTTLAAVSALEQGYAQKQAAEYNAMVAREQARQAEAQGRLEQYRLKREKRRAEGTQRSLYAKAGLSLEGSPLEVLADTASEYDLDLAISKYNTEAAKRSYENRARYYKYAGKQAMRAGYLTAGTSILMGASAIAPTSAPASTAVSSNTSIRPIWTT